MLLASVRGSLWVREYLYCHQTITKTIPGATRGKSGFFKNSFADSRHVYLAENLPRAMNLQVVDFAIIHQTHQHYGTQLFYIYSHWHQTITHTHPRGDKRFWEKGKCGPENG